MAMGGKVGGVLTLVFLLVAGSEASYSYSTPSGSSSTPTPTPVTTYPSTPYSGSSPTTPDISYPTPDITTPTPDISSPTPDSTSAPYSGSSPTTPDISSPTPEISSPTPDVPSSTPYTTPTPDGSSPVTLPPVTIPDTPTPVTTTPTPSRSSGFKPKRSGKGTCRFWRSNTRRFPNIISILTTIARIFGGISGSRFGSSMTVVDALTSESNDAYSSLARHAVASLLNSYTVADFTYSPQQVREQFNQALATPQAAAQQALLFERANDLV